jgi:hypothetical protein
MHDKDIQIEQLKAFIHSSHERIREAFTYIEGDNVAAAAYCLGQLDCLHDTLLGCYDDDEEQKYEDKEENCNICEIDKFLKGFKAKCQK